MVPLIRVVRTTGTSNLAANQRSCVTDCVHTVRYVPDSNSCASWGPPRKTPKTNGSASMAWRGRRIGNWYVCPKELSLWEQS